MCIWGERGPRAASQLCICLCQGVLIHDLEESRHGNAQRFTRADESFSSAPLSLFIWFAI